MTIILNGERFELDSPLSVTALLAKLDIDPRRVAIEHNLNIIKRHERPRSQGDLKNAQAGGIVEKEGPIDVSNVAIICPTDGATRVGYRVDESGHKTRICRKCGGELA